MAAVGCGWSPGICMAIVGVRPVPLVPYGDCEGVAILLGPYGRRVGVANPLDPVWPPWGRFRSYGSRIVDVGVWPVFWALYGCRGVVAGPLIQVWPL